MIKRDDYLNKIKPIINDPLIKVITGMRRVGKSTLLLLIQDELNNQGIDSEQFIHINFELIKYDEYKDYKKLYEYVTSLIINKDKYYIFLDEIQEVENFEKVVNSINIEYNTDIYITGSNSKLLSGELASLLTGRYYTIEVFPLSFKEIVEAKEDDNLDVDLEFINYINNGGLPAILRFKEKSIINGYIDDMYSSIVLKDIVTRYSIRDVDLLNRFLGYIYHNIGQIFSASSITKFLKSEGRKLSRETIYNYINACKEAYLIYGIKRYDIKGKQYLKTKEKYFINDLGIRSLFFDNENDISQSLENIVLLELLRRGYAVYVGEINQLEVDFIAMKGSEKIYIQVTYMMSSEEIVEREFKSLESIKDNFAKYIISMDKIKRERSGIKHMNIIEFLLSENDLIPNGNLEKRGDIR